MDSVNSPLVSVVIPTFNRRSLIAETISSVLNQTYTRLELIIVDDGSTDGTHEFVLDSFGTDPRLRYITQSNGERAVARNRGIKESRGELIGFLDSDDIWLPQKLELQVASLGRDQTADCCYCLFDVLTTNSQSEVETPLPPENDIFEPLLRECFVGSMTPLIRRHCFETVGGFCEDRRLLCFEDWEMWTRLASQFRWILVPEVLGRHRLHAGNTQHAPDVFVDELRIQLMADYSLSTMQRTAVSAYSAGRRWHWASRLYCHEPVTTIRILLRLGKGCPRSACRKNFWGLMVRAGLHACSPRRTCYSFGFPRLSAECSDQKKVDP